MELCRTGADNSNDRICSLIGSLIAARTGQAAAEDEIALRVVEHRLPGDLGVKPGGLGGLVVERRTDSGNARGCLPEIGVLNFRFVRARLAEENKSGDAAVEIGHDNFELGDTGARAWAIRVGQHHQREAISWASEAAVGRPATRRFGGPGRGSFISEPNLRAAGDSRDPQDQQSQFQQFVVGDSHGIGLHAKSCSNGTLRHNQMHAVYQIDRQCRAIRQMFACFACFIESKQDVSKRVCIRTLRGCFRLERRRSRVVYKKGMISDYSR
jgi:hypothetical protein